MVPISIPAHWGLGAIQLALVNKRKMYSGMPYGWNVALHGMCYCCLADRLSFLD